jgi:hypothetical protein
VVVSADDVRVVVWQPARAAAAATAMMARDGVFMWCLSF